PARHEGPDGDIRGGGDGTTGGDSAVEDSHACGQHDTIFSRPLRTRAAPCTRKGRASLVGSERAGVVRLSLSSGRPHPSGVRAGTDQEERRTAHAFRLTLRPPRRTLNPRSDRPETPALSV